MTAYAASYWLREALGRQFVGEALILLGPAFFFGNVTLISQQYNVEAHVSWAFLALFAVLLPLPYLFNSRMFTVWVAAAFLAGLLAESNRNASTVEFHEGIFAVLAAVSIGFMLIAISAGHRFTRYRTLVFSYELAGVFAAFGGLHLLGFYRHDIPYDRAGNGFIFWLLILPPVVAITLIEVGTLKFISGARELPKAGMLLPLVAGIAVLVSTTGLGIGVALWPRSTGEDSFFIYTFMYWPAFPALAAVLVWLGAVTENSWWSNIGLVLIGLFVLSRYFDLFSGTGQRSLVFVGSGLLLLIALATERSRRLIEATSEAQS